tara:strand:+ start:43 stop:570 length:528 start_codon:yes stop_codon:yes gene_type:complete
MASWPLSKRRKFNKKLILSGYKPGPVIDFQVDKISCITDYLFLSAQVVSTNYSLLQENNITHIVNCTHPSECFGNLFQDICYMNVPVLDKPFQYIRDYFETTFQFIDEAISQKGKVLVHCHMGISRSVTIVVAYLMKKYRLSLKDALLKVTQIRPIASPSIYFHQQLLQFEKTLK